MSDLPSPFGDKEPECAVCRKPTTTGDYKFEMTDKYGYRIYAFTHPGTCDDAFKKTLSNPDIPLGTE